MDELFIDRLKQLEVLYSELKKLLGKKSTYKRDMKALEQLVGKVANKVKSYFSVDANILANGGSEYGGIPKTEYRVYCNDGYVIKGNAAACESIEEVIHVLKEIYEKGYLPYNVEEGNHQYYLDRLAKQKED